MKNDRLFQLLYLLLEKGTCTAPELSKLLEVSVRTVYRDVEALSMAGIPVCTAVGKGGGISLMPGYTFEKALLSGEEQNQLLFAVQSLQAADQEVGALLSKLGSAFQKPTQNWIEVDFSRWGMRQIDTARFELLKNAILGKQELSLLYCGTNGETSQRLVHPLKLIYKDKYWYLQAFCLKAQNYRVFKVSRIIDMNTTGKRFEQDETQLFPSPMELPRESSNGVTLELLFSKRISFRVYDEFERSCITPQQDGSLRVEVVFPPDDWVVSYLFSFGTEVTVLAPEEIKVEVAEYAEKICMHHRT